MTEEERDHERKQLADEVARMQSLKGQAATVDKAAALPSRTMSVAEVMPEMIEAMERQRKKWAAFCDSIRPEFDALPEAKACPHHPLVMRPKLFEETCQKSRMSDGFKPAWAPCSECADSDATAKRRAFWSKRGVPGRVLDSTLSNFQADTEERVTALGKVTGWIKRNGVFLLLTGTTGTGKGHMAVGCLKAQGNGLFITHADMLSDLRASYTLQTTPAVIKAWQEAEMLVLDEFGLSAGGKDEEPMLYQVLACRYENRRPTVITSNLEIQPLREAIGFRLLDRMQEDCTTVICNWLSWRKKNSEEKK